MKFTLKKKPTKEVAFVPDPLLYAAQAEPGRLYINMHRNIALEVESVDDPLPDAVTRFGLNVPANGVAFLTKNVRFRAYPMTGEPFTLTLRGMDALVDSPEAGARIKEQHESLAERHKAFHSRAAAKKEQPAPKKQETTKPEAPAKKKFTFKFKRK